MSPQYKPQEPAKANWATIRRSSPWAIESWGLGTLGTNPPLMKFVGYQSVGIFESDDGCSRV